MPFYEYRCAACGHQASFLENMNAPQKKTCPACSKRRAFERLVSAAGFQLKGSGWYVTDFKNQDKKPAAKQDKKAAAGEGKTDKAAKDEKGAKADKSDKPAPEKDRGGKKAAAKAD